MPRRLHYDGKHLYRGKKKILSSKLRAVLLGDKKQFKNGRERSVLTSLALVKMKAGVGPLPFDRKTEFVIKAVRIVQEHVKRKASSLLKEIMEDLLARSRCLHAKGWAENVHTVFTDFAYILTSSSKPSLVGMVCKADERLAQVKILLHRVSIWSTAYPKATWRDCLSFAVGSAEAQNLVKKSIPGALENTTHIDDFYSAACQNVITGVDSGFFERAVELCIQRKSKMIHSVGSYEDLVEQLFTQISSPNGAKDKCLTHLAEALRKSKQMIASQKGMIAERDQKILHLQTKISQSLDEGELSGSESLRNDSKRSHYSAENDDGKQITQKVVMRDDIDMKEDGEISEDGSDATLNNLPPIPDAPIDFIPSPAETFVQSYNPLVPPETGMGNPWNAAEESKPIPQAPPNHRIGIWPNTLQYSQQPFIPLNVYPQQDGVRRYHYMPERGPHTTVRRDHFARNHHPPNYHPTVLETSFGRDHSYKATTTQASQNNGPARAPNYYSPHFQDSFYARHRPY